VKPLIQKNENIDQALLGLEGVLAELEDLYGQKREIKDTVASLPVPGSFGSTHRKFVEALSKSLEHIHLLIEVKQRQSRGEDSGRDRVLMDLRRAARETEILYQASLVAFKTAAGWEDGNGRGAASGGEAMDASAYFTQGMAYHESGNQRRAVEELAKALALNPGHEMADKARDILSLEFSLRLLRGERLLAEGLLADAIDELDSAARIDSSSSRVHLLLGQAFFESGNMASAIAELNLSLKWEPESTESRFLLGLCHMRQGQADKAAGSFRAVLERQPNHGMAHVEIARIWAGKGEQERAIDAYETALKHLEAGQDEIRLEMARVYRNLGRLQKAREYCEQVLGERPKDQEVYHLLAQISLDEGDDERALEAWSRLLDIDPNTRLAVEARGAIQDKMARHEERRIFMEENLKSATLLRSQGLWTEARTRLARVMADYPGSEEAREAEILLQQIEKEQVIEEAREGVRRSFQWARNWILNGNHEEAIRIYDEVMSEYPNTPFFEEALRLKEDALKSWKEKGTS